MAELSCLVVPEAPVASIVEIAKAAEAVGCRRVWIPDEGLAARDCYVTLAAIAAVTDRIELGPGITNGYTRHPGVTATAMATLDELSDGRAVLGVGAGGGLTLTPLAIDRASPLRAIRDVITVGRQLWAGEVIDHDGISGRFVEAKLGFSRPNIAVWIAGRGPKVMALGGELADGFMLSYLHKDLIGDHIATIADSAKEHERPRPRLSYTTAVVTTDQAFQAAKRALTFRLVDSPWEVKDRIGMSVDDTAKIRAAIAEGGPTAATDLIRDSWVDQFAIVGTLGECRRELQALLAAHDLDEFQVSVTDLAAAAEDLDLVASLVNDR